MIPTTLFNSLLPSYNTNIIKKLPLAPLSITQRVYQFINRYFTPFAFISIPLLITASAVYIIYKKQKASKNKVKLKIITPPSPISTSFKIPPQRTTFPLLSLKTTSPLPSPKTSFNSPYSISPKRELTFTHLTTNRTSSPQEMKNSLDKFLQFEKTGIKYKKNTPYFIPIDSKKE